jgi:hypothetical protein
MKMEPPASPRHSLSPRRTPTVSVPTRSEREALRKTNHSKIEKRRRKKTNEALTALRELVPLEEDQGAERKWEKEFKLEILERTVAYLQKLTQRDRALQAQGCTCGRGVDIVGCGSKPTTPRAEEVAENVFDLRLPLEHLQGSASPTICGDSSPPRLPPISALFSPGQLPPHYATDPRLGSSPYTSPNMYTSPRHLHYAPTWQDGVKPTLHSHFDSRPLAPPPTTWVQTSPQGQT